MAPSEQPTFAANFRLISGLTSWRCRNLQFLGAGSSVGIFRRRAALDLRRSGQFWVWGERAREGILKSRGGLVSPEERRRLRGQGGVGDDDWQLWPPPQEPRTCLRACRLQRGAGCVVVVARCGRAGGESSSGLRRRVCLEREEGGGGDDGWRLWPPPQHRGCLSLLYISSLSLLSLSRTCDASSPLLVSLSLVSLRARTAGF